jgi:hypothetical protein
MTNDTIGKHMVWTERPGSKEQLGMGYSTLAEAEVQAVVLKNAGYTILRIVPMSLPKPNG